MIPKTMTRRLILGLACLVLACAAAAATAGEGAAKLKSDPKTRDIQILMVTALNELGDIEQASECGTDDFVSKPVNKFELLTRVKSLLRVRHLKSELERALTYLHEVEHEDETN